MKWYQLTKWMPEKKLTPFIKPFKRHNELDQMEVKKTKRGYAIFTNGKYQARDTKEYYLEVVNG